MGLSKHLSSCHPELVEESPLMENTLLKQSLVKIQVNKRCDLGQGKVRGQAHSDTAMYVYKYAQKEREVNRSDKTNSVNKQTRKEVTLIARTRQSA